MCVYCHTENDMARSKIGKRVPNHVPQPGLREKVARKHINARRGFPLGVDREPPLEEAELPLEEAEPPLEEAELPLEEAEPPLEARLIWAPSNPKQVGSKSYARYDGYVTPDN
jgi:hypothetical protein